MHAGKVLSCPTGCQSIEERASSYLLPEPEEAPCCFLDMLRAAWDMHAPEEDCLTRSEWSVWFVCCSNLYEEAVTLCLSLGERDAAVAIVADMEDAGITAPADLLGRILAAPADELGEILDTTTTESLQDDVE